MKVFNTLSGKKEEFVPQSNVVTMYVCGITPYDDSHVGHAMSYIIFDVVRRYLKYRGYSVKCVQNVTDIDDKIITRSNRLGVPAKELAEKFTQRYFDDMDNLNVMPADFHPRATEEIPMMLDVIKGLIDKGYAYPAKGSVYFRVRNVPDYGKLSKRSLDAMSTGASVETGEEKEDPLDFVLWKAAKPGEPSWDSPWGKGRPGWHIECSAMSLRYLGETIDIHGGGQDLVFPHHENEITQSESFTGKKPFVKYWMHNGSLQLGAEKMSKSLGNLVTIRDALKKYSADALRIFVLSSYYRSPLTYTEEALEAAQEGADKLRRVVLRGTKEGSGKVLDAKPYYDRFIEAMDDDFNTAQAIATLFDLARDINQAADTGLDSKDAKEVFLSLSREVLGLKLAFTKLTGFAPTIIIREKPTPEAEIRVNRLIEERVKCRKTKQWQRADEIRARLAELGIILEDNPQGTNTTWKHTPTKKTLDTLLKELGITLENES
jgi:cysteinyl-tRNA synthetase